MQGALFAPPLSGARRFATNALLGVPLLASESPSHQLLFLFDPGGAYGQSRYQLTQQNGPPGPEIYCYYDVRTR
jgi:hypothetical protein